MAYEVKQVDGYYVFSCPPKELLKPVFPKHKKMGQLKRSSISSQSSHLENMLYFKAAGKNRSIVSSRARYPGSGRKDYNAEEDECPPVLGRTHMTVQTDMYLEELCDVIEEVDVDTQTDPLLDRPASPLFVPAKIGLDVETQVWPGELFDFDREVQPLLEVLVGQTIEQSLVEIMEEEELAILEDMQQEFEMRRNAELAERQRLEEQERRLFEERQKRLREQEEAVKLEEEVAQKIAACVFAQNYLSNLMPQVYRRLEEQGYMVAQNPIAQEVEETFWPWLMDEVDGELTAIEASYSLLDSMIENAVDVIREEGVVRPVTPDEYPERIEEPYIPEEEQAEPVVVQDESETTEDNEILTDEA